MAPYSSLDDTFNQFSALMGRPTLEHLPEAFTRSSIPELEMHETESAVSVDVDLPEPCRKDVTVELAGSEVRIHCEREWEKTRKKDRDGTGSRTKSGSFDFSARVQGDIKFAADAISAVLERGVLQIEIPEIEPTPSTRIAIEKRQRIQARGSGTPPAGAVRTSR